MKKLLLLCIALLVISPIFLLSYRHFNNPDSTVPYPFVFEKDVYKTSAETAPILIIGDAMAHRLATLKSELSHKISGDIDKTIEIHSLAKEGEGLHRTLEKLKKIDQLPLIIILLTNHDVTKEIIFKASETQEIYKNLEIYEHPLIKSFLLVFPRLAKYFYNNINYALIKEKVYVDQITKSGDDSVFQRRMQMYFKLYSAMLGELFSYATKRNSIVIPVTTPINLKNKPKKSCYGSIAPETQEIFNQAISEFNKKDYKSAYNLTKDLALINSSHSASLYLHGLISEKLNRYQEAQNALENSKAYDCASYNAHPVFNIIMKKQAKKHGLEYLDFHQYLYDQSRVNTTFLDDIYPQDLYLEKLADMLAFKIKSLLKLN